MKFHHSSTWVAAKGVAVSVAGSAAATCGIEWEFVDGKSTCNVFKKQFSRWDAD